MRLEDTLAAAIEEKTTQVAPPPLNVDALRRRGHRRRLTRSGVAAAAVVALVGGGFAAASTYDQAGRHEVQPAGVPQMDFSQGLRGFAEFDGETGEYLIHLGGRTFPADAIKNLDTSGAVTPYGLVLFGDDQEVRLLTESGGSKVLAEAPDDPARGFSPTVKYDAQRPLVAWVRAGAGTTDVTLYDLARDREVASVQAPCPADAEPGSCMVEGVDQGMVFLRTPDGGFVWDPATGSTGGSATGSAAGADAWSRVTPAGGDLADVRAKTILVSGDVPATLPADGPLDASWRVVKAQGPDAELSFDGRYVYYWSPVLQPTTPDARPVTMRLPSSLGRKPTVFGTFDTDGSLLLAGFADGSRPDDYAEGSQLFFDCSVSDGSCTEIGQVEGSSGDPMFVGNDM